MLADAMHGADDQRDHADLDAEENRGDQRLVEVQPPIDPGHAPGSATSPGSMKPSPARIPPSRPRFIMPRWTQSSCASGPGKHLIDRQQPVEALGRQPFLFLDQLALDHRDLGDRPAPGEQAEAQEAREDRRQARRLSQPPCVSLVCRAPAWACATPSRASRRSRRGTSDRRRRRAAFRPRVAPDRRNTSATGRATRPAIRRPAARFRVAPCRRPAR